MSWTNHSLSRWKKCPKTPTGRWILITWPGSEFSVARLKEIDELWQNPLNKTKIHDKAVQSNIPWLNLNKIDEYFTISRPETWKEYCRDFFLSLPLQFMTMMNFFPWFFYFTYSGFCFCFSCYSSVTTLSESSVNIYFYIAQLVAYTEKEVFFCFCFCFVQEEEQINKRAPISHSCAGLKTQIPIHSNSMSCPKIVA